ncbi:TPA: hypothetical protein IUT79_002969 [Enterococcus faecalis]|nr:hypothetical protein [Enterococcus faecalis]
MNSKKELEPTWGELIFGGLLVMLFIFMLGYMLIGIFKSLETSLKDTKQETILRSAYENNENTDYVLKETILLKAISAESSSLTKNKKEGNSKIGKFFIRDTEEITNEQVPKQEFYYFVASKDGIQKKNFKEETGEELTSKNVFFKEISASEQPKIEIKVKEFSKRDLENERRSIGLEEKSYTIYLNEEDFKILSK